MSFDRLGRPRHLVCLSAYLTTIAWPHQPPFVQQSTNKFTPSIHWVALPETCACATKPLLMTQKPPQIFIRPRWRVSHWPLWCELAFGPFNATKLTNNKRSSDASVEWEKCVWHKLGRPMPKEKRMNNQKKKCRRTNLCARAKKCFSAKTNCFGVASVAKTRKQTQTKRVPKEVTEKWVLFLWWRKLYSVAQYSTI